MRVIAASQIGLFFLWMVVLSLAGIASRLFLAFCIYNDAKYRQDENAVLWAVLSGFIGFAALVYIIIKVSSKNQFKRCVQCGEAIAPDGQFCPRCGRSRDILTTEELQKYNKRRKLFLGLWIGFFLLAFIAVAVFIGVFMSNFMFNINHYRFR